MVTDHLVNPALLRMTRERVNGLVKASFVPGGDPSGGMAPPGGDPAAAGGAPPGGAPGGDPAAGGPPPAGGGGGQDLGAIQPMIQQAVQQAMMMQGGGQGGAGGPPLKPKIDVNVEMMQIKNMLAKICDHLQIQIPAQDMVATPDKLMAMSQGQSPATPPGTGQQGQGQGAIAPVQPMDPMQGAAPGMGGEKTGAYRSNGVPFDTTALTNIGNEASALSLLRRLSK